MRRMLLNSLLVVMGLSFAAGGNAFPAARGAQTESAVRVVLETPLGEVEVALYPERAPLSVAQFLRYVEGGHYAGAHFYRATHTAGGDAHDVVQGGLRSLPMLTGSEGEAEELPFRPVAHETTDATGLSNERGVLAYARLEPGTANSEFFFNLGDNRVLDTGAGDPGRDDFGYATFGRVVRGMEVLDAIHRLPTDAPTAVALVRGQMLTEPVPILRARRLGAER